MREFTLSAQELLECGGGWDLEITQFIHDLAHPLFLEPFLKLALFFANPVNELLEELFSVLFFALFEAEVCSDALLELVVLRQVV